MHRPRSSSAYQVNQSGESDGQGTDQSAANQIEGREETPVWQKAFVLGPNVRFTRTPDRAPSKSEVELSASPQPTGMPTNTPVSTHAGTPARTIPVQQAPQPQPQPAPTAQPTRHQISTPKPPARTASPSTGVPFAGLPRTGPAAPAPQPPATRVPASVTLPQPPDAIGARALTYKLRRELARQQAEQAAWEASVADGAGSEIGPAPQNMQPAPLVQGMRSVLASTQAATVSAAQRPANEASVPPHLQRSLAQQAEAARLAALQAAHTTRAPMVRNAFLRTPVQTSPEPAPAQPAAVVPSATSQFTSGFAAWAQMTAPAAQVPEASATVAPQVIEAEAKPERLPIAALLSDHIFFEAMIEPVEMPSDIEMVRPAVSMPLLTARLPAVRQTIAPSVSQAVRTIPARAPEAAVRSRAEVVRYRPDALTTAARSGMALPRKPAFEATAGSVMALYREVARRDVTASTLVLPSTPMLETVAPLEVAVPPAVQTSHASIVPVSAALPRQPLFRAQEALGEGEYELPYLDFLQMPPVQTGVTMTAEALEQSAGLLESVLEDFGIKGEVIDVRPGPVVTLYEFEPAPGVKSSRVIGLSDDIARSMSALSARVAVVPGRNVIGIELPNPVRETVYLRELIETPDYAETRYKLPVCLGKTIGGEPVIAELAKMPHLLVAGTTGSGKSVAINTMILSLLYRFRPDECRLIMVDPKMLELSVYDGIPHLLTPVVTDPKKAVMALKWAVREMEDRYRKMSRLGVRNIDGYNARAAQAREKGETITVSVQTGFDRQSGEIVYEDQELDLSPMPYIVVVVDEMADLMMVAGKEIEGAIQRLAQMARAAGIHLIMATQRPSVDVITGTIKANFPTRVSFQVTSKIDSRTILGEPGAEHLLGQGDMLHMVGGGRIARVHGPFVSDEEVEKVVAHLKMQGRPDYLGTVTEDADDVEDEPEEDVAVFDKSAMAEEDGNDLYDKAVKVVLRDKKCSTSYIQRRLSIGYNKAASLVERMEQEGIVGAANHVGKRAIIVGGREVNAEGDFEG
ncbi:DNA translocase FtsK [Rhizobium rhizophilum]|uniref:DNA translocase FtsK n=1 Tax=Rhizobium rhizophilum TaxID=1850373 RepID=A0ABY2R0K7_9HYPH|nr:DNA translocase FtsK [Rhizobium rhizophilum]THV17395.1 DNA translocase FtsK [Rhizobium rhizophilum]